MKPWKSLNTFGPSKHRQLKLNARLPSLAIAAKLAKVDGIISNSEHVVGCYSIVSRSLPSCIPVVADLGFRL